MNWQQHDRFTNEFKKYLRKQRSAEKSFNELKKLLAAQFDADTPQAVIAPGKLHHRMTSESGWELWKVEMMVKGVRPNQCPRIWFVVCGNTITFLAVNSHVNNYDDNTVEREAMERYDEVA